MEEIIRIKTKRRRPLKQLLQTFGSLGFNKVDYTPKSLTIEKVESEDIRGKPYLYYRLELLDDSITLKYTVPSMENRVSRSLEMGLLLLNMFELLSAYYDVQIQAVYPFYFNLLKTVSESLDTEKIELYSQFKELKQRYNALERKYNDLVQASASNARILVEYERKNDELEERVKKLEGMGDEELQVQLFEWIKSHDGEIDVLEFSRLNSIAMGRVEEGLDALIKNGFIRKR
jgi:hypothetical protein